MTYPPPPPPEDDEEQDEPKPGVVALTALCLCQRHNAFKARCLSLSAALLCAGAASSAGNGDMGMSHYVLVA